MPEHKLTAETLARAQKRTLITVIPMALLASAVGMGIGMRGAGEHTLTVLLFSILLSAIALGVGMLRGWKRQKQALASYRLYLENDQIRRIQDGLPEVVIPAGEISRVLESVGRGMTVRATRPKRQIHIPDTLEDYAGVRFQLAGWRAIEDVSKAKAGMNSLLGLLVSLLTLAGFWITYTSTDRKVVVVAGTLFCAVLVASLVATQRSKEIPAKTKKTMWLVLLPIVSIAFRVWMALDGH